MKLSVVIIAKNAEGEIADLVQSVNFADEILVVDNGSTDRTIDVAKYFKAKVLTSDIFDFSKLRNLGLTHARGEWILYVDSDERVTPSLRDNIKYQISHSADSTDSLRASSGQASIKYQNIAAFKIKRRNFYLGNHEWPYVEKLERLFRKDALRGWKGKLHESPIVVGEIGELDGFLLHYTHRNLTAMLSKTIEWSKVEAELRYKAGHPKMSWWRFFRVMVTAFYDSYIKQGGWKVGTVGLIESLYQAFSMFVTYARLWEMSREAGSRSSGQQEKVKIKNAKVKITT